MRQREGIFYLCPACDGRAVTVPQIRRVAGDRAATALLRQINRSVQLTERPCPFCTSPMRLLQSDAPILELDACRPCGVVWFDPGEFEQIPEGAIESPDAAHLRGVEAMGNLRLEQARREYDAEPEPDSEWKTIPAIFGFPVETHTNPLQRWPWFTWLLSAIIAAISIWAFFHLRAAVEQFGFIPADAFRLGGLTWLSSFFLHGGIWHLVGNLYFLLIFGDNVEDYLGRWRCAALLLAATIAGDLVHVLAQSQSTVPCIGASGGISGVIVFYALQFPRARLSFLFRGWGYYGRHRWHGWGGGWWSIPAWVALAVWLLMQSYAVVMQLTGFSNVAATAHLGGAAVGFAFWLWWRRKENRPLLDV
jgi:membrane associated rhomboid family serine protease/Zn-finger nucleic acid-binding protein